MNYTEIKKQYLDNIIPYGVLLHTDEWKSKREEILKRDNNMCTKCGTTKSIYYEGKNIRHQKTVTQQEIEAGGWGMVEMEDDKSYDLHVHHKLYIENRLPWEYKNDQLVTLCNWCHWKFHEENDVPFYDEDEQKQRSYTKCNRCNGMGRLPEYSHVKNGICFWCYGAKYEELIVRNNPDM